MTQAAYDKYINTLKEDGTLIINSIIKSSNKTMYRVPKGTEDLSKCALEEGCRLAKESKWLKI